MYKQHAFQFEEHLLLFENVLVVGNQLLLKIIQTILYKGLTGFVQFPQTSKRSSTLIPALE